MAYILNIETATRNCSVSIAKNGNTLAIIEIAEAGYSHAEKLHIFIESALLEANITYQDLNAVAVSQGPGSYTGLRIGVSAAKGLCYALGIPMIAVDTLKTLAMQLQIADGLIVPMIDARRMEVYNEIFDAKMNILREVRAEIIDEKSFSTFSETIHFLGDGAAKCKTVLENAERFIYHDAIQFPSAAQMSALSYEKCSQNNFVDVAYFEPFYLKDFLISPSK